MIRAATLPSVDAGSGASASVELLGVARLAGGCSLVNLPVAPDTPVHQFLCAVRRACPGLDGVVVNGEGLLLGGHVLSRDGLHLVDEQVGRVQPGDRLLLFTLAAGGSDREPPGARSI